VPAKPESTVLLIELGLVWAKLLLKITVSPDAGPAPRVLGFQLAGMLQLPLAAFQIYVEAATGRAKTNMAAIANVMPVL